MTTNTFSFMADPQTPILRLSKNGIRANSDIPVNDAAKALLDALDNEIKSLINSAVEEEREIFLQVVESGTDAPMQTKTLQICLAERKRIAAAIRARSKP